MEVVAVVATDSGRPVPSAATGAERRVRAQGGRNKAIKVRLTDEEYVQIGARAEAAQVSRQRLIVEAVTRPDSMTYTERRALYREVIGARNLVAAIGNNLNQIARVANTTGVVPVEVRAAAEAASRAVARLDEQAAALDVRPR